MAKHFTASEVRSLAPYMTRINSSLNTTHEYVAPKFTKSERTRMGLDDEYGGITGTLSVSSFLRIIEALCLGSYGDSQGIKSKPWLLKRGESVFCDIGCGTGRPSLYMAGLGIRGSIGFDIDPMQVLNGCSGVVKCSKLCKPNVRPILFYGDVMKLRSLEGVTHAYAFAGYSGLVMDTAFLVASSKSVECFVMVVIHTMDLRKCGLLHPTSSSRSDMHESDRDVVAVSDLIMGGGTHFTGYVFPMTERRRERVMKCYAREVMRALKEGDDSLTRPRDDDPMEIVRTLVDEENPTLRTVLDERHLSRTGRTRRFGTEHRFVSVRRDDAVLIKA